MTDSTRHAPNWKSVKPKSSRLSKKQTPMKKDPLSKKLRIFLIPTNRLSKMMSQKLTSRSPTSKMKCLKWNRNCRRSRMNRTDPFRRRRLNRLVMKHRRKPQRNQEVKEQCSKLEQFVRCPLLSVKHLSLAKTHRNF